jgi:cobalt/nickel transport system permease protein
MHIPDGYLSPSTCVALYASSTPFWYTSLRRMNRVVHTGTVPLISVFAAFAFIVMMFNLPLPGGTTGHAVGVGITTIVLGPWGSILAISTALVIQALLFGDGGITAIGANCFNMAIAASLAAYAIYRAISGRAPIGSSRRAIAAGVAGYLSINFAALLAAIELGIQPQLFHDASGAPLYAPYPLHIAIPAMMIGHLTIAGIAEAVVSAGVVAYLQRAEPSLLIATAPRAIASEPDPQRELNGWRATKRLWLGIALLLILTPLGILAVGSAWGEWSAPDFSKPETRQQMASASRNQVPPAQAPAGLQRLASLWTAPMPRYAPTFLKSAAFGYILSAIAGTGLIVLIIAGGGWLWRRTASATEGTRGGPGFVERTLVSLIDAARYAAIADETAQYDGVLQRLDPRVKVVGLLGMVVVVAASHRLLVIAGILVAACALAKASRITADCLARLVWIPVVFFTGVIALPAIFLTPGQPVFTVATIHLTAQGSRAAAFLILRAGTGATLCALLILSTPWSWVLKALRVFKCPKMAVLILGMTYRYIFVILQTAFDMLESRKSRTVGVLDARESRRLATGAVGVLLSKSFHLSSDVHLAMRSRAFQGEVNVLHEFRATAVDWYWLTAFAASAATALWWGR